MSKWLDYILFVSNGESGLYYRAKGMCEGMCCTDSCPVKQTFLIV